MNRRLVFALVALGLTGLGAGYLLYRHSMARAQGAPKLILFWEKNFQGRSLEVTGTLLDLPVTSDAVGNLYDWNDEVRSLVVVSGTWRLYQHGRCNTQLDNTPLESLDLATKELREGWSCLVSATSNGPLKIPDPASGGFFHDVSSIELVAEENLPDWALPQWRTQRR